MKIFYAFLILFLISSLNPYAQTAKDLAISIWANCDTSTGHVTLTWEDDSNPGQFSLF